MERLINVIQRGVRGVIAVTVMPVLVPVICMIGVIWFLTANGNRNIHREVFISAWEDYWNWASFGYLYKDCG